MTSLSEEFRYYHKDNHSFVKPLDGADYGIMVDYVAPYEARTGFALTRDDFSIIHPSVQLAVQGDWLDCDQYGYVYPTTGLASATMFFTGYGANQLPAYGNMRVYEVWGRCTDYTNLTLYDGVRWTLSDDNAGQRWFIVHQDNGSNWDPYIAEYIGGVWTLRGAPPDIAQSAVPVNHKWFMRYTEVKDLIFQELTLISHTDTSSSYARQTSIAYRAASRPQKDEHNARLQIYSGYSDKSIMAVRGFRITHL